jgi:hypothetical protein
MAIAEIGALVDFAVACTGTDVPVVDPSTGDATVTADGMAEAEDGCPLANATVVLAAVSRAKAVRFLSKTFSRFLKLERLVFRALCQELREPSTLSKFVVTPRATRFCSLTPHLSPHALLASNADLV